MSFSVNEDKYTLSLEERTVLVMDNLTCQKYRYYEEDDQQLMLLKRLLTSGDCEICIEEYDNHKYVDFTSYDPKLLLCFSIILTETDDHYTIK